MIEFVELAERQLDTARPDIERFGQGAFDGGDFWLRSMMVRQTNFEFFGLRKRYVEFAFDRTSVCAAANAKHLCTLHTPVINNGNVGRATADVHQNGAHAR